jgi:hypothetical protein
MTSLYRAATSYEAFEDYVKLAERRINTGEQHDEFASIKFWRGQGREARRQAPGLDRRWPQRRLPSLFDDPKIREVFALTRSGRTLPCTPERR